MSPIYPDITGLLERQTPRQMPQAPDIDYRDTILRDAIDDMERRLIAQAEKESVYQRKINRIVITVNTLTLIVAIAALITQFLR